MIVPDIILRDQTCLVFCFLGCVVKFQAREANSWPRSASSNPGDRVCVLFVILSLFSFPFPSYFLNFSSFAFTFIKLVKPVRHHTNCLKKYITIKIKYLLMTWLVQTNKGGAKRRGKA